MSREMKFRAWDSDAKRWALADDVTLHSTMWTLEIVEKNAISVEQFTGLKDKTGKDIYEGDIVEFDKTFMTVEWSAKKAQFYFWQRGWSEYHDPSCEAVVIGNIHENPELLK